MLVFKCFVCLNKLNFNGFSTERSSGSPHRRSWNQFNTINTSSIITVRRISCRITVLDWRETHFLHRIHRVSKAVVQHHLPDSTFSGSSPAGAGFSRWANTAANGFAASGSVRYISQSR